ncbi:HAD family hydrolase [Undibacterium sp. CY18W]|uniref:HAD family hydrolase n=1 Tax=Undibacterium hunanense TaxID=2762292 RepID=A0ABR6ZRT7_9BURK|nr:HAD family hydrolase [Undibacterium hunanense]MBC3918589.1 HAD family hydrolase [Undibacterium hunanense]
MVNTEKASLLFDIDNTLIDRDAAFLRYLQDFMDRNQNAFADEDVASARDHILALDCHGRKDRSQFCQELLQNYPGLPYTADTLWADHLTLPDFVQADSLLENMLERLSTQYQLMIISNGSASMQHRKLGSAGLSHFFEHVFISADIGYEKPDRRLFSHALDFCRHTGIVMIGDDYFNDMQPAMALQLKTVFVKPGKVQVQVLEQPTRPDREITSIYALEEALTCLI